MCFNICLHFFPISYFAKLSTHYYSFAATAHMIFLMPKLPYFIPQDGIFWGTKMWQVFCWLDLSGDFLGGVSEQSDALGIVLVLIFAPI